MVSSMVFVRGTTLSVAAGILFFCFLARYWNWILVFLLLCLSVVFFVRATNPQLFAGSV
jgi:hypothetical protein